MKIGDTQIHLIHLVKKYLNSLKDSGIDISKSGQCYFPTWTKKQGMARLKFWQSGWLQFFELCYINLKDILAIASHTKYIEISNNNDNELSKKKVLVITWSFKNGFNSDGSYHDKYFDINSKNLANSYWILISMDNYIPDNLNSNLKALKLKKGLFKYDFLSFFKILLNIIFKYKFSPRKIFHYLTYATHLANQISLVTKKELKKNNFDTVIMPYEAQPFQNNIYMEAKKYDKKILTIGYLHSLLPALPCDYIFRDGAPDLLCVHGTSQNEILKSKLGWPKDRIKLIKSLRFRIEKKESMSGKIFLPHTILEKKILIKSFKKLLIECPSDSFKKLTIVNHPTMLNSKKHLLFKKEIENLMKIYKDKFRDNSSNIKTSIFFGYTGAIFEALEKGNKVIHIFSDPILESLSREIWTDLEIKKLNDFSFEYNLPKKGSYINFGNKNFSLEEVVTNCKNVSLEKFK